MVVLRKLGAWFVVAMIVSAPALACFERTDLTPAEQECCKRMADRCGSMNMPDSHSCCTTKLQRDSDPAVVRTNPEFTLRVDAATASVTVLSPATSIIHPVANWLLMGSPPEGPPRVPTVLRI
ncbi:MAG TPA: hypothetical protein VF493_17850 [Terriglobales bacterium]